MNTGLIQQKATTNLETRKTEAGKQTVNALMNSLLDSEGMRTRFDSLLGKRAPQFVSSLITLVNADENLQKAFYEAPMTIIQAGLKAASFDLPIEPSLGFAYIVPFNNSYKDASGQWQKKTEATFVLGYKGLIQLCLRTGAYSRIPDAVDVRQGELLSYDRLTGDAVFSWIEDEDEREKAPIIGYVGYFRLKNGAEKTLYMTKKQIEAHEIKNRKGKNMGKGWREDFDAMAKKTVIRRLINHYGLMSIDYQDGNEATVKAAENVLSAGREDFDEIPVVEGTVVDEETGEVFGGVDEALPWEGDAK